MIRRRDAQVLLALVAMGLAGSFCVPANAAGTEGFTVWEAGSRLDPHADAPGPAGLEFRVCGTAYDAAPEVWTSSLRGGWEPHAGIGGGLVWSRFWITGGPAVDRVDAHFVRRGPGFRILAGARIETDGAGRAMCLRVRADREWAPGVMAGLRLGLDPAASGDGGDASVLAHAAWGAWMAGLELGGGSGLRRLAVGVDLTGPLVWTAAVTGGDPSTGFALRLKAGEIRFEETHHALLGRVTTLGFVLAPGREPGAGGAS